MENAGMKKFLWELFKLFLRWLWGYAVLVPVVAMVGVVFVSSRGVPPDFLAGQWAWLGRAGMAAGLVLVVLILADDEKLKRLPGFAVWTLIVLGGVEAVLGLLQVFGLRESNHALFTLTGSFYNPGPYSGYLALVLPLAVNELIRYSLLKGLPFYTALTVTLLIICVLPAGMSRAAWLAAGVSVVFLLDRWLGLHRLFVPKGWRARLVAAVCLIVIAASAAGMYLMKKDSADGRLLVWKISLSEAMKHPVGWIDGRTFSAVYGEAQEEYFSRNGYTDEEERVAEVPDFAFNEYIQAFMMTGIWGLAALLLVLGGSLALCRREKTFGVSGALLSVGIFAFFSYPFHIPAIVAAFVLLVIVALTDYFYKDGKFQQDVAMKAMKDMFDFYGIPFTELMAKDMWVTDFGLGDFEHVGMGGIFWINDPEYAYFAHAIYLLPGQMIPEHAHVKTEYPAKHESWMVEKGWVYNFSEIGEESSNAPEIPAVHGPVKSKNFVVQKVGDVLRLKKLESFHFMMAGPEGAVVDEWACYHDNAGLRFTNAKAAL